MKLERSHVCGGWIHIEFPLPGWVICRYLWDAVGASSVAGRFVRLDCCLCPFVQPVVVCTTHGQLVSLGMARRWAMEEFGKSGTTGGARDDIAN